MTTKWLVAQSAYSLFCVMIKAKMKGWFRKQPPHSRGLICVESYFSSLHETAFILEKRMKGEREWSLRATAAKQYEWSVFPSGYPVDWKTSLCLITCRTVTGLICSRMSVVVLPWPCRKTCVYWRVHVACFSFIVKGCGVPTLPIEGSTLPANIWFSANCSRYCR